MRLSQDREVISAVHATILSYRFTTPSVQADKVVEAIDKMLEARQGVRRPNGPQTTGPWNRTDRKNGRPDSE